VPLRRRSKLDASTGALDASTGVDDRANTERRGDLIDGTRIVSSRRARSAIILRPASAG
jgi:hypothetical protein